MDGSRKGITVEGVPLDEWLKQQEEKEKDKEVKEEQVECTVKVPLYARRGATHKTYPVRREKNGRVEHWTKDRIRKEYGMDSLGKLSVTQKIIWIMLNEMGDEGMVANDIYAAGDLHKFSKSPSGALTNVWNRLGTEGGAGLISRVKEENSKAFRYYKTEAGKNISFDDAVKAFSDTGSKKAEPVQEKQPETKLESVVEEREARPQNININITVRFLFGLSKD